MATKIKTAQNNIHTTITELFKEWNPDWKGNNKVKLTKRSDRKIKGDITLTSESMVVTGKELIKETERLSDMLDNPTKYGVTPKILNASMFNGVSTQVLHGVADNKKLFIKIEKKLKALKIGKVIVEKSVNIEKTLSAKTFTIGFRVSPQESIYKKSQPEEYFPSLKNLLKEEYSLTEEAISPFVSFHNSSAPFDGEQTEDIEFNGQAIGTYFKERNYLEIRYSPFGFNRVNVFTTNHLPLFDILNIVEGMRLTPVKVLDLEEKIFISSFLKGAKESQQNIKQEIGDIQKRLIKFEQDLGADFIRFNEKKGELEHLGNLLDSKGKKLFPEIQKIKKLPFVENVKLNTSSFDVTFKPTCILINNFKDRESGGLGKRYVYTGSITFTVRPNGFNVRGDAPIGGHCHPHSGGNNERSTACFGDGAGRDKIYALLSSNNFYDLGKMLWFWIKTFRDDGAYIKMTQLYNDRLSHGYPVFDEKGNRIEINEKERIKSGEQTTLSKEGDYAENIKKFKTFKLEV